jgi:hypothetical protein
MLRSLGSLFLFLATASLAQENDYKVWMVRTNYTEAHCEGSADVAITAQMHQSVFSSSGGYMYHTVTRVLPDDRNLRAGASPRDLGWCDAHCRCQTILMCQIGGYCADSCCDCACGRRMEEEPSFLWSQEDVVSSLPLEVVGKEITAGEEGGIRQLEGADEEEDCPAWDFNMGRKLSYCEIDDIMTCSARKGLKALARELISEGNRCLGNPDLLQVHVDTHCDRASVPQVAVNIGLAGEYVILTKSGIATVPDSTITGDIGVSPIAATALTGFSLSQDSSAQFSTSTQLTGQAFAASYGAPTSTKLTAAVSAMEAAYTDAAGRVDPNNRRRNVGAGTLGGLYGGEPHPLTAGIYTFKVDVKITSDIFFVGVDTDVFIIQTTGNLIQAANKKVILTGGALAKNIFWQVAGYVEVGAGAHLEGILLAKTKVDFLTGSSLIGRVLAQTACNLQMATITEPLE